MDGKKDCYKVLRDKTLWRVMISHGTERNYILCIHKNTTSFLFFPSPCFLILKIQSLLLFFVVQAYFHLLHTHVKFFTHVKFPTHVNSCVGILSFTLHSHSLIYFLSLLYFCSFFTGFCHFLFPSTFATFCCTHSFHCSFAYFSSFIVPFCLTSTLSCPLYLFA